MSYYDNVSALSPKLWYKFNGDLTHYGSLTNALTEIGTGSATTFPTGVVGNACVKFNGGKYYRFGALNSGDLFDDRTFSIELWAKGPATTPTTNSIFEWVNGNQYIVIKHDLTTAGNEKYTFQFDGGTSYPSYDMISSNVARETFHHIVVTFTPSAVKLYIDGVLDQTVTNPNIPNSFILDTAGTSQRQIGVSSQMAVDEFAVYGQELTATQVFNNYDSAYNAGALSAPLTASALLPMPAIAVVRNPNYTASAMTASATFPMPVQSARDNFTLLDTYMSTLTLEQFYKFDEPKTITNYGSGDDFPFIYTGNSRNDVTSGVQNHGALRITGSANDSIYALGATSANPFLDENFSIGFWVKKTTNENALIFSAHGDTDSFTVDFNASGQIKTTIFGNNQSHTITSSTDYADGNWHYVAVRLASSTLQLWVDGTSIGTTAYNHTLDEFYVIDFGSGSGSNTELMYVSHFYIATATNVTSTEIANIWSYGQATLQGGAAMPMPKFSRNNSLNYYIEDKSPVFYFKMDEATGVPLNYGSASISLAPLNSSFTQNITSPNYKAYNFTDRNTQFTGAWSVPAGTFTTDDQQTIVVYTKFNSGNASGLFSAASFGGTTGAGLLIQQLAPGTVRLRIQDDNYNNFITTSSSYADGNYHMIVGVKDATSLKLYIDGKEIVTGTIDAVLTDAGQLAIGGLPGLIPATGARDVTLDELAVFDFAFTAGQAFDIYQKIALVQDTTATALMVQPTTSLGFGPVINPGVGYATALLPDPTQQDTINNLPTPITATALLPMPNFAVTQNVNYSAAPMTAAAQGENPVVIAGANKGALHMDASASFPEAYARIPGRWNASPAIANPAEMVQPAISSTRGGLVKPQALTAKAFIPTPPAYVLLTDDPYYVRLYTQHSNIIEEPPYRTTNLPNQENLTPVKSYLKFFSGISQNITVASGRYLTSNLPEYIFARSEQYIYDSNGNIVAEDTSKVELRASGNVALTPTPTLSRGFFDDKNREAARINNIEFAYPETSYIADRRYSLEFTFKATKGNQIIAYGRKNNTYTSQSTFGSIGLFNGKLFAMTSDTAENIHPTNRGVNNYMLGNKIINDGQWHHIVVQWDYEGDYRTQFWIDGELDRQVLSASSVIGSGNGARVRPYIIGKNSDMVNHQSDFQTSVWSYDPASFLSQTDIGLNYLAYSQSTPIEVGAMTVEATMTPDNKGRGNRARALMLYFWSTRGPDNDGISSTYSRGSLTGLSLSNQRTTEFDQGKEGVFDVDTFFQLSTWEGRAEFYDWDIFPVDVTGQYTSKIVKPSSYKNAFMNTYIDPYTGKKQTSYETSEGFRDDIDDTRYIDLINDIEDLSSFDMICFRNYPEQGAERDSYSTTQFVDRYFGIREEAIFKKFIDSLRAAVDTGLSLYVTNPQLAIDLGIVDRVETVTDLDDNVDYLSDATPYGDLHSYNRTDAAYDNGYFDDLYKNNRHRVANLITGLTDEPGYILTEKIVYKPLESRSFIEPERTWIHVVEKPTGLTVGDEFIFESTPFMQAVPLSSIKAGKAVTTFAATNKKIITDAANPFASYATTIAVQPGDTLNGTKCLGKIFVNFTELPSQKAEEVTVELITDYWIDKAFTDGVLSDEERVYFKTLPNNIDRKLAAGTITQAEYNAFKYWDLNGANVIAGSKSYGVGFSEKVYTGSSGRVITKRKTLTSKGRKGGVDASTGTAPGFSVSQSYINEINTVRTIGMISRGFFWLSEKASYLGTFVNPVAMTATADSVNAIGLADKDAVIRVQASLASATINETTYRAGVVGIVSLPMFAEAKINAAVRPYFATPGTTTAFMPQNVVVSSHQVDQVVLYVMHEDPILYIREDVIK